MNIGTNYWSRKRIELGKDDIRLMDELYKDGFSLKDIARLFETSSNTVHRRLREFNTKMRSSGDVFGIGPKHPLWKGGRRKSDYALIWVDPNSNFASMRDKKGYVLEHRLIMAQHIGRPLRKDETVHHINGNSLDNDLLNLQLRTGNHGEGQVRRCGDCGSINIICEGI